MAAVLICLCGGALATGAVLLWPRDSKGEQVADIEFVRGLLGEPPYYEIVMHMGEQPRQEKWFYPDYGVAFSFVDGQFAGSDDLGIWPAAEQAAVSPAQFEKGMSIEEVSALVGEKPTASDPLPEGILRNAVMVLYPGVIATFENDGLVFLESASYVRTEFGEASDSQQLPVARKDNLARIGNLTPPIDALVQPGPSLQVEVPAEFDSPLTAGIGSSVFKFLSKLVKIRSTYGASAKVMDMGEIIAEVNGAINDFRFMSAQWREQAETTAATDPFKAAQLQAAADKADEMAKAMQTELLPRIQGRSTWEALEEGISYVFPPVVGDLLTEGGGDLIEIRQLLNEYTQNQTGRHGRLRESLVNFITENYAEYWGNVPMALRESIVVDVMAAIIHQRCRNEIDPAKCAEWALEPLLKEILNEWGRYHDDCLNSLEELKERLGKDFGQGKRMRQDSQPMREIPGVKSCPIRVGREEILESPLSRVDSEPYGVFLAGNDVLVGQQSRLSDQASCGLVGWGVDCSILVRQVAAPGMVIGPFESLSEAMEAYCDSLTPGSIYSLPLLPGRKANFSFDGLDHWISNAPTCSG